MSRKNYRAVAAVLSAAKTAHGHDRRALAAIDQVEAGLVAVLKADNERFDVTRFRAAVNEREADWPRLRDIDAEDSATA